MTDAQSHHDMRIARNELKYYISHNQYIIMSNMIGKLLNEDAHNKKNKGYFVRSLYFDTLGDKSYEEKAAGIDERTKYRLRIYDINASWVKFEIKSRHNNYIIKDTASISMEDAAAMQSMDYDVMLKYSDRILNKAYKEFKKYHYKPVVMVDYERHAFISDFNDIRIVFDKALRTTTFPLDLFDDKAFPTKKLRDGLVILEIKYNHFIPDFIKQALQIPSFERSAVSKYCIGRIDNFDSVS